MSSVPHYSKDNLLIVPNLYPICSYLGIKLVLTVYGADTSGLVVEGDVVVIGILPEAQILLKIIFPLLVT